MSIFKKTLVVGLLLSASFAKATTLPSFEILDVKAPAVSTLEEMFGGDIKLAALYEMGEKFEVRMDCRSEFEYSMARQGQYKFPYMILEEAEAVFRPYLTNYVESLDFRGLPYKVEPSEFQNVISRVLSSKYFNNPEDVLTFSEYDLLDFTKITPAQLKTYLGKDYTASLFIQYLSDRSFSDEKIQSYKSSMYDPTISFAHESKFPLELKMDMNRLERSKRFMAGLTLPENAEDRQVWYPGHDLGLFTQDTLRSVFATAKRIYDGTNEGDNIVIFGNTPYYVGRALKILSKSREDKRNIVDFPFSGGNYKPTQARLDHFKKGMESKGFFSTEFYKGKHTYFIDVYYKAAGLSYTLDVLVDHLSQTSGDAIAMLANISAIALNNFNAKKVDTRQETIVGTQVAKDQDVVQLTLPNLNEARHKIACQVFFMPEHDMFAVGSVDKYPHLLRGYPKYNANFWHPAFDYLLSQEGTPNHKIMIEHFDANIKHLIAQNL